MSNYSADTLWNFISFCYDWNQWGGKHAVTISAIFTAIHELFTHMEEGMQASWNAKGFSAT